LYDEKIGIKQRNEINISYHAPGDVAADPEVALIFSVTVVDSPDSGPVETGSWICGGLFFLLGGAGDA
jgi:hypothetical protein